MIEWGMCSALQQLNGEMSQNTALAGLLSRDTHMRKLAGDIP
jgi:hypothetical protein